MAAGYKEGGKQDRDAGPKGSKGPMAKKRGKPKRKQTAVAPKAAPAPRPPMAPPMAPPPMPAAPLFPGAAPGGPMPMY